MEAHLRSTDAQLECWHNAATGCARPGFIRDVCESGDVFMAEYDLGRAPHRADSYLALAAKFGRLDIVTLAWPLAYDDCSAAYEAFSSGHLDCTQFFLSKPITFNSTHLAFAIESGNVEVFEAVRAKFHPREFAPDLIHSAYVSGNAAMIERVRGIVGLDDWNFCLVGACVGGHRELAESAIAAGADAFADAFIEACVNDHRELAAVILRYAGAANFADINLVEFLRSACESGHQWAIDMAIKFGADDWGEGLSGACTNGTTRGFEIAKTMIARGAVVTENHTWDICGPCLDRAAIKDHDFVRYILARISQDPKQWSISWMRALSTAMSHEFRETADHGIFSLVWAEFVAQRDARTDWTREFEVIFMNNILETVAHSCNATAIDWLVAHGADNFDLGLCAACEAGSSRSCEIATKFIELGCARRELGARDFDGALVVACSSGNVAAAKMMIARGATDVSGGINAATRNGHFGCAEAVFAAGVEKPAALVRRRG